MRNETRAFWMPLGMAVLLLLAPLAVGAETFTVTLDNGIGETVLRHRNGTRSREGIMGGTDVRWDDGPGTHTVQIDLNVGEIRVRLQ